MEFHRADRCSKGAEGGDVLRSARLGDSDAEPDGSEQRVIYGVPENLSQPERFKPTPWEAYTYDANDLATLSNSPAGTPLINAAPTTHHFTPASIEIDALGRTIKAVERNGSDPKDWYTTRSTYDIRGNVLTVTDALSRVAFKHVYDLANRKLKIDSIDAGVRRMVLDVMGNPVEQRDSKGALTLHAYDRLNRPIRLWARDGAGQVMTLRERSVYGDSPEAGLADAQASNLLGKLYRHYDEAGLITLAACDFKGNVLGKVQQVIRDEQILSVFNNAPANNWQVAVFRVDWQPTAGATLQTLANALLESTAYTTSITYDALNRIKGMRYPQTVDGTRKELIPRYNRSGALEQVDLDGKPYVERIAYNAKGQRVLIAYGNGVITRHAYDPQTFRLVRLRSQPYDHPNLLTYQPKGAPLQEFAYEYDLVGNITKIRDRTPEGGISNSPLGTNALDRVFGYDAIYRLLSGTGLECDLPPESPPWVDEPRCADLTKTRAYTENYQYDSVGNIQQLQHQVNGNNRNRNFALVNGNNRLDTVTIGQTVYRYTYDVNGNLIQENGARHFEWDYGDRMRVFRTQTENAEPTVHAHYLYDASGQRVKKLVRKQGGQVEVTVYIDGVYEYQRIVQGGVTRENNTLHVMDNQSRIALVRVGDPFPDDTTPAVKFHLSDHLGSSNVVVDEAGNWVNREEHTPYGETSFGSFARKRYRFTGKERDEESGLYYFGARYYSSWSGRWISADPKTVYKLGADLNVYGYVRGRSVTAIDQIGLDEGASLKTVWVLIKSLVEFQYDHSKLRENKEKVTNQYDNSRLKVNIEQPKTIPSDLVDIAKNTIGPEDFTPGHPGGCCAGGCACPATGSRPQEKKPTDVQNSTGSGSQNTLRRGPPELKSGVSQLKEFDIDRYGTISQGVERSGDKLAGHELLQNFWLKVKYNVERGIGTLSRDNPSVAVSKEVHAAIGEEQRALGLFDEAKVANMTAEQNINLNALAMRRAGGVPEYVINQLKEQALEHANTLPPPPGK